VLLQVRNRRVHPGLDDKILTDWNGLMIAAMARGYRVLGEERFLESARRAAAFALGTMTVDGRLMHSHRDGRTHLLAYIDDHANLLWGLIELFEATFELEWLRRARALADRMIELFWDGDAGCFFFAGADHEELIARMKPGHDGATPSGNAVAANALLRLQALTGDDSYGQRGLDVSHAFHDQMKAAPSSFAHMIAAVDYYLRSPREIVLIGDRESAEIDGALRSLWEQFRPHDLIVSFDPASADATQAAAEVPLLAGKVVIDQRPTFYLCENYACQAPTHNIDEIIAEHHR